MFRTALSLIALLTLGFAADESRATVIIEGDSFTYVEGEHFIIKDELAWTWASPCAGGCSQLVNPLPDDWRFATALEFAMRPVLEDFAKAGGGYICTSNIFDPIYNHCDIGDLNNGFVTSAPLGNNWDTLLVHDLVSSVPAPAGLALLGLGLLGIGARRRTA